jgi:hypothetical protein
MASTYTTRIRLEKQGTGDNDSTWGVVLNENVIDLIDTAIAGYTTISLAAGDVSLTTNDGSADEARSAMLHLSGTLTGNTGVYLPSGISKIYVVRNSTSGAYDSTVLINGGTGHVVPQGSAVMVYTDGTTVAPVFDSTSFGYGTAATLNFGTSVNELIPVSAADVRYVTTSATQTVTGDKTYSGSTVYTSTTVQGVGTQAYSSPVSVAVSTSSVEYDLGAGNNFTTVLNANVTFENPVNPQPGQSGIIYVRQDGTGSRTVSFAANWQFSGGNGPTLSTAASAVDALIYNVRTSTAISGFFVTNLS